MTINQISQSIYTTKNLKRLNKLILVCFVFLPAISCAIPGDSILDSLAMDKSIRTGRLPNGFTYYLKPTSDTDNISLRFYVKVGRFNERLWETEQYAHLMEHFGYIEGYLKSYYSENDSSFKKSGHTTFANTGTACTRYWSSVQSNDIKSLKDRLEWFYNISNMELEDSLVIREARCVRQEAFYKGKGFGLNQMINREVRKAAIFFNADGETPYTDWLTTYDMGGVSVPSVREFYHSWYHPDRMGLIITGNIQDIDGLEQNIIAIYSKIPKSIVENEEFDMRQFYLSSPPKFKVAERTEVNRFSNWNKKNSEISMFFRVKRFYKNLDTKEKWINKQLYKAMYHMVYQRLSKNEFPFSPIQKEGIIDAQFPDRSYPYFRMPTIENKSGTEQENLQRLTSILQHLQNDGFTHQEWNKQKQVIISQISSQDTTSSKYWEKHLENHFVYGEILPKQKKKITKLWINNLTLKDINSYLHDNFFVMPDDIYITASAGHSALSFTENQVRGWIKDAIKQPMELKETIDITRLIPVGDKNSPLISPNEVKNLKEAGYKKTGIDPNTGLEVLELDNGVKIILDQQEPNDNSSESITINGSTPRGASCFPEEDYYSAISATEIVKLSGAGGYNRKTIQNKLGRESFLNLDPVQLHIMSNSSTVSTRAKLEDLEKYLQLVYLYFTSPRKDSLAFEEWQTQIRQRYFAESSPVSPRTDFKNAIADFLGVSEFKSVTYLMSTEQFYQKQNVQLDKAIEYYNTIFGNASDFTFIVQGKYEKERILPLLQKYLGNLPTNNNPICSAMDDINKMDIELPNGPLYQTFYADEIKTGYKLYTVPYMLSYIFSIPENNWKDYVIMDFVNIYLDQKVRQELRFIKGAGLYYQTVEGRYSKVNGLYNLAIFIDALDDELEWIRQEIKTMIVDLKDHGINMESKNTILKDPLYLGRYASTPKLQEKATQYLKSLNAEDFKIALAKYIKKENLYEFVFRDKEEVELTE